MADHEAGEGEDEGPVHLPDVRVRQFAHALSLVLFLGKLALPASCPLQVRVDRERRNRGEYHADKVPLDRDPDRLECDKLHQRFTSRIGRSTVDLASFRRVRVASFVM